jgi:hypothetical protein
MAAKVVAPAMISCIGEVARSDRRKVRSRRPEGGGALAVAATGSFMACLPG